MKLPKLLVPLEEQAVRFVRLFGFAFLPQVLALSGHLTRDALLALVLPCAETAWKELQAQAKQRVLTNNGIVDPSGDPQVGTDLGEDNPPDPNA